MTMDRHATIGAMLDEYALGHLSRDERRDVEKHVRECNLCAADLRELSVVMEGIAHSVEPVTPPPALRQRVIASLALQPQEPPRRGSEASAVATPFRRSDRGPMRAGAHSGWLAAAAVVILGLGTALYSSISTRRLLVDDVQQAQAEATAAQQTANELRRQLDLTAGQADLVVAILTADDMQPVPMAGRENATATVARAFWSPARGLLIVADDLPTPPPGRVYQVWVIGATGPVSAGLLGEQGSNRGMLIAPPPPGLTPGMVTVAVTDEPPGGLAAPTGTIRLVGSV